MPHDIPDILFHPRAPIAKVPPRSQNEPPGERMFLARNVVDYFMLKILFLRSRFFSSSFLKQPLHSNL